MFCHTGREAQGPVQVGAATGVHAEALRLVDRLRARLRAVAAQVAKQPQRPRVLSLEGLKPLCLGDPPSLGWLHRAGRAAYLKYRPAASADHAESSRGALRSPIQSV